MLLEEDKAYVDGVFKEVLEIDAIIGERVENIADMVVALIQRFEALETQLDRLDLQVRCITGIRKTVGLK